MSDKQTAADALLMAQYLARITPDRNAQTDVEADETETAVEAAMRRTLKGHAMADSRGRQMADNDTWRETVRAIFDTLHSGEDDIFTGKRLARRLVSLIEDRHHGYFCGPEDK